MKAVHALGLIGAGLLASGLASSAGRVDYVSLSGTDYVRLEDWAAARNLQVHWVAPKQELKLISASSTLCFWADSRKISINGVHVWISAPIAMRHGSAYIPALDLTTTVQPVLFATKNSSAKPVKTIVLDPGHGGKDPGNREGRQQEKKYTLLLANELSGLLKKAGFNVSLTRSYDTFVELDDRAAAARRRGADLFISLHFNSADGPGSDAVHGTETYCMTPAHTSSTNARGEGASSGPSSGNRYDTKNLLLAYQIQKSLVRSLGTEDRGVRRARFAVLREATMPAVLIEAGFMTHPTESRKLYDSAYRRQIAQAVLDGVMAYNNVAGL
jgi:N-acetylmuramoyl-L-alanine amidase